MAVLEHLAAVSAPATLSVATAKEDVVQVFIKEAKTCLFLVLEQFDNVLPNVQLL
jgi:hypothetical protein